MNNASNHSVYAEWSANTYTVKFAGYNYTGPTELLFNPVTGQACTKSIGSSTGTNNGCMKWYAFLDSEESETVNLILDHNTTGNVSWNADGGETPVTANTQLVTDVSNWNENIKNTARLITASEVQQIAPTNQNWDVNNNNTWYYLHTGTTTSYRGAAGSNTYDWLFDNTSGCVYYGCNVAASYTSGYWTSDFAVSGTAWYVSSSGSLYHSSVIYDRWESSYIGIPPVITVDKKLFNIYNSSIKDVTYGNTYGTLPTPAKDGYTFNGWYTTGGVKVESNTIVTNTANHTLYAQWIANTYTISFDANAGINFGIPVYFNVSSGKQCTENDYKNNSDKMGNTGCLKFYVIANNGTVTSMLLDHNITLKIEWINATDYAAANTDNTSCAHPSCSDEGPITAHRQLKIDTANWQGTLTPANYTDSSSKNGSSYGVLNYTGYKARFLTREDLKAITGIDDGFKSLGSYQNGVVGSHQYAWLFDYTKNCVNYGCNVSQDDIRGYWLSTSYSARDVYAIRYDGQQDYTEAANADGGIRPVIEVLTKNLTIESTLKKEFEFNSYYSLPANPARTGYTFMGWYTSASGGTKVDSTTQVTNASNHTLYAQWQSNCFVAGTQVYTENGYKNIEDIKVGEKVYSYNFDTNSLELSKVVDTIRNTTNTTYKMTIGNSELEMTHMHPLYIVGKGWVEANKINIGDKILDANGNKIEITNITTIEHSNPIPIYNITVDGNHNYYVGNNRILVHNKGDK